MVSQQRGGELSAAAEDLEDDGEPMEVFVRRQDGSLTALSAKNTDTVEALKQRVCKLGLVHVRAPYKPSDLNGLQLHCVEAAFALGARLYFCGSLSDPWYAILPGSHNRPYAALVRWKRVGGRHPPYCSELLSSHQVSTFANDE